MTTGHVRLVPLAITLAEDGAACVAGPTGDGTWLRPEPVTAAQVTGDHPGYEFFRPVRLDLAPSAEADARPEDRAIVTGPHEGGEPLAVRRRATFLRAHLDPSVAHAFDGGRSTGLVRAYPRRLRHRRATGGRVFLRLEFTDASGAGYDWIVRDVRLLRHPAAEAGVDVAFGSDHQAARWRQPASWLYLAVGLTKPNGRFPGRFRGCHPLVVGVHPADGGEPSRWLSESSATEVAPEGAAVA